jgi:hypothetical protein
MVYAFDIIIIGRSFASMRELFHLLEETSKEVLLVIYEGKTKYTVAANTCEASGARGGLVVKALRY